MPDNTKDSYAIGGLSHEACLLNACRAFAAGCRFSVFEPEASGRQHSSAGPEIAPAEGFAPKEPSSPLVLATYEAEPDEDDLPLAGQAAYLRRGACLDLAGTGPRARRAARDGEDAGAGRGEELLAALRAAVEGSEWPAFAAEKTGGVIRRHDAFSVSLAGCANACSNPHIADLGLIAVWRPELNAPACPGADPCAKDNIAPPCAAACPENAVKFVSRKPSIDRKTCLDCGRCIKACPRLALANGPRGWRVCIGGRLGRRPRLAAPMPGLVQNRDLPKILAACLDLHMKHYRPGARFADTAAAHKSRLLKILAEHSHI